jgi:hypothetical protein
VGHLNWSRNYTKVYGAQSRSLRQGGNRVGLTLRRPLSIYLQRRTGASTELSEVNVHYRKSVDFVGLFFLAKRFRLEAVVSVETRPTNSRAVAQAL